jgi:hypothetical protein
MTAPSDVVCAEAWKRVMEIARAHALIVQASGGSAVLAVPEVQRMAGLRERTLRAHLMTEHVV